MEDFPFRNLISNLHCTIITIYTITTIIYSPTKQVRDVHGAHILLHASNLFWNLYFFYQEKKMKNEQTRGSAKVCYVALWLFPPG